MKKLLLFLFLLPLVGFGQDILNKGTQLGVRVGGGINYGSGFDITYIKPLGTSHRLDITMPFRFDGKSGSWHVDGYYEFTGTLSDEFMLFVGPGAGVGASWNKDIDEDYGFLLNLGGIAGITYSSDKIPFDIDFSIRPTFVTINNYDGAFNIDFTLGFLYRF
ncbi:hypothetical protein K5X82_11755 [Halosquirtibacter xylanolyticus]|uniref:hypothetical protein n=1 Tax=Halosquirtibacter xylanolyticus TaxID=3374599 RepID=UPI0037493179|nr:hypothetical protein K5X82_11755 [Prolixibacteraceae bacterium]